jgi:hypothetical protein
MGKMISLEFCLEEQRRCLREARVSKSWLPLLGLEDWVKEEVLMRLESMEKSELAGEVLIPAKDKVLFQIKDSGERQKFETGAVRDIQKGKGRYDLVSPFMLDRLARWYELGAGKYGDRNWEKGIPFSRYVDSACRHLNKYRMGYREEDHLSAAIWNLACIVHFEEIKSQPELDDLPRYV